MPFAATWMDLESVVILSKVSQRGRNIVWYPNLQNRKTHRLREWTYDCWGKGRVGEFGKVMYTLLYLKWITKRTYMGVGLGGEWTHVWLSPFAVHLKLPQHCSSAMLQYKRQLMYVKSLQSCTTRCDPMDCSPPGSSIHVIFQERILEGVVMPSSRIQNKPAMYEWSNFSTSSHQHLVLPLYFNYSGKCVVISQCSFNLHFM